MGPRIVSRVIIVVITVIRTGAFFFFFGILIQDHVLSLSYLRGEHCSKNRFRVNEPFVKISICFTCGIQEIIMEYIKM